MTTIALERFVGREKELNAFREVLNQDKQQPYVFFLQGPGGIGKTWLMKRCLEIASAKANVVVVRGIVDMYSTNNRYVNGVIESIVSQIPDDELPPQALARYRRVAELNEVARYGKLDNMDGELNQIIEDMSRSEQVEYLGSALRDRFQDLIVEICKEKKLVLAFDTFENVQNGPVGKWVLSSDGLQIPGVICLVASRLYPEKGKTLKNSYLQPYPVNQFSDEEAIDLYYKYTGSRESRESQRRYVSVLNKRVNGNPFLLGLATLWLTVSSDDDVKKIEEYTLEEFEEAIVSWLHPLSGKGSYHLGGADFDEPMRQVIVFMSYLNRRFNRHFLQKLADENFVRLGVISADDLWQCLNNQMPEFFFVKDRPEGEIQLHDKLAEMLRRYLFVDSFDDLTGTFQRHFADRVVAWYDELIGEADKDDPENNNSQVWRAEKIVYLLRLDISLDRLAQKKSGKAERAYRVLSPRFQNAIKVLEEYNLLPLALLGRLLVNELSPRVIQEFPDDLRFQAAALMGEIALTAYQTEESVVYWQEAEAVAVQHNHIENQIKAILGQYAGLTSINLQKAVGVLEHALETVYGAPQFEAEILYKLGYAHRRLENISKAIEYYEKAKDKAIENRDKVWLPTILNDLGYAYAFQGTFDPDYSLTSLELRMANLAIDEKHVTDLEAKIRQASLDKKAELHKQLAEAQKQVRQSKLMVGLTHNTLGQIYRFSGALTRAVAEYSQALSIFQEIRNKRWEAEALFSRGEAHRRLAVEYYELGRKAPGNEHDTKAYRDIDASVEICESYNFADIITTAYRRKGLLYHDRFIRPDFVGIAPEQRFLYMDQAHELFETAYKAAEKGQKVLEQFTNLAEIAFLGDDIIEYWQEYDPEKVQPAMDKARANLERLNQLLDEHGRSDIKIQQYPVFAYLAKMEEGHLFLVQKRFEPAFQCLRDAFVGLAKTPGYGQARYKQHLPYLFKVLRMLDTDEQDKLCHELVNAWEKPDQSGQPLAGTHPEFLRRIKLFQSTRYMNKS